MNRPPATAMLTVSGRPARLLLVDDQPANLEILSSVLGKLGGEIVVAADGATALKRAALRPVDLILLDLNMPGMDGLEVCRRLEAAGSGDVPVIFISGTTEKNLVVRALDSGGVDYITKPFNHAELVSRVRTQLELKSARDRLQQLAEDKDELIGILAHDLKSQLGGMQMSAQLLHEKIQRTEMPDARARQLAENLEHSSGQLLAFVKGFLANAAADHGISLKMQPVPLGPAVAAALAPLLEPARRKKIVLQPPEAVPEAIGLADPAALGQVLDNLLSNALKFSPPDTTISLGLAAAGAWVECRIQDQGPGFTDEDRRRMFRRYARLSARPTGGEPSSGLGLSIVRKLVLAMNGELQCDSQPGHGAKFTVRLPRAGPH